MGERELVPGLHEALVTADLDRRIAALSEVVADVDDLAKAEASDRLSRHLAGVVARVIEQTDEADRVEVGTRLVRDLIDLVASVSQDAVIPDLDQPLEPATVLRAILRTKIDGTSESIEGPLTPLLDTTVLTNAPGEPAVGHELQGRDPLGRLDRRRDGVRPLERGPADARRSAAPLRGRASRLRVLTTTYTNSTELRALEELAALGAEVTGLVRHHVDAAAREGLAVPPRERLLDGLHRLVEPHPLRAGDRARVERSGLGRSQPRCGGEDGGRLRGVLGERRLRSVRRRRVPAAIARRAAASTMLLSPIEIELRPFQERLLEQIELARPQGHHRNLLVAATGTGKTVMAAVDYARLRTTLPRDRLLFVAHREEILDQSRRHVPARAPRRELRRDVGRRDSGRLEFEHVFASIQSLNASGLDAIDPSSLRRGDRRRVPSRRGARRTSRCSNASEPRELLGLTATPERADGLDVLRLLRRTASPPSCGSGMRSTSSTSCRSRTSAFTTAPTFARCRGSAGTGYDVDGAHQRLHRRSTSGRAACIEQVRRQVGDPRRCGRSASASASSTRSFMAEQFYAARHPGRGGLGDSRRRRACETALRDLAAGRVNVVFTVDLFNEGVDVPTVDTLLLLRPTESPTLFLQQLGRGLRRAHGKAALHGARLRRQRTARSSGSTGASGHCSAARAATSSARSRTTSRSCRRAAHFELDPVAREIVLRSIRDAIPSDWARNAQELRSLGDVASRRTSRRPASSSRTSHARPLLDRDAACSRI